MKKEQEEEKEKKKKEDKKESYVAEKRGKKKHENGEIRPLGLSHGSARFFRSKQGIVNNLTLSSCEKAGKVPQTAESRSILSIRLSIRFLP